MPDKLNGALTCSGGILGDVSASIWPLGQAAKVGSVRLLGC